MIAPYLKYNVFLHPTHHAILPLLSSLPLSPSLPSFISLSLIHSHLHKHKHLYCLHQHSDTGGIPKLDVCQSLQPEDYIDIMWTTSAELPGVIVFALLSLFLGRRVLMAGGVTLCAIFTGLLYLCQHRYVCSIKCAYVHCCVCTI